MKKFLWLLLLPILVGCSDFKDGIGANPHLNIEKYAFPQEGGSIEIYSTIDYSIHASHNGKDDAIEEDKYSYGAYTITGNWYKVKVGRLSKYIQIEVQPNESGVERMVPITIWSGNFVCKTHYIQKAD